MEKKDFLYLSREALEELGITTRLVIERFEKLILGSARNTVWSAPKSAISTSLDVYVTEQKRFGRFERPLNNSIYNVTEWMQYHEIIANDTKVMVGLSFMFLLVCLLSTIALLLTKFVGKKSEISLRRALGASRRVIFNQQIVEVAAIGFAGGLAGLLLALAGLQGIEALYESPPGLARIDWVMMFTAIGIAIVSGVIAGLYPAWRVCQIPPAAQLKAQ